MRPPEPLGSGHDLSQFNSGQPSIDLWLRERAMAAEARTARTYVVCEDNIVIGYHSIATGSVERAGLPRSMRHGNPDPVPVAIIARLGVTLHWQRRGMGESLLQDAIKRILLAADIVGIRAILVHALSEGVAAFYRANGFQDSPIDSRTLLLPVETARAAL